MPARARGLLPSLVTATAAVGALGALGALGACGDSGTTAPAPPVPPAGLVFVQHWWSYGQVAVADTAGRGARTLAAPVNVNGVDASPDGTTLAFDGGDGTTVHVYLMAADGTGVRRLTDWGGAERHPAWSPDGARIAYERSVVGGQLDLYVTRVGGGATTRVTNFADTASAVAPAWSSDGRRLAFTLVGRARPWPLYVVDADGRNLRRLDGPPGWSLLGASWAPDGRRLVASGRLGNDVLSSRLFLVDVATGAARPLLDSPAAVTHELYPAWSPDGAWIAFASNRGPGTGGHRIYKVRPDGTGLTAVTAGDGDGWPRWRR